jgi:hypothetical protein
MKINNISYMINAYLCPAPSDLSYKNQILKLLIRLCIFIAISFVSIAGLYDVIHANNIAPGIIRKSLQANEIKGVVDSVILEDLVKEIRPKISIIAKGGRKHTFVIRPTTTIYDREWKPITLDKIHKGQFVRIRYRMNKEGYKIAISIKPSGMMMPPLYTPQHARRDIVINITS